MSDQEPPSPELERLLGGMREDVLGPAEVEDVVRRVRRGAGPPPDGGGSSLAIQSGVGLLAAAAAVALLWWASRPEDVTVAPLAEPASEPAAGEQVSPVRTPPAQPEASSVAITPDVPAAIEPSEPDREARTDEPRRRPARRAERTDPAAEHALLMEARRALPRDPARALELADNHRALYPRGLLAQEREMIAIDALESLGREAAARARALTFLRRWADTSYAAQLRRRGYGD